MAKSWSPSLFSAAHQSSVYKYYMTYVTHRAYGVYYVTLLPMRLRESLKSFHIVKSDDHCHECDGIDRLFEDTIFYSHKCSDAIHPA